ncbi:unnamed protein product, partial [Discosporangium mesarthrocarpum]
QRNIYVPQKACRAEVILIQDCFWCEKKKNPVRRSACWVVVEFPTERACASPPALFFLLRACASPFSLALGVPIDTRHVAVGRCSKCVCVSVCLSLCVCMPMCVHMTRLSPPMAL